MLLLITVVALRNERHRRTTALTMIGIVWVELHYSIFFAGALLGPTISPLPATVVMVAFLGARPASKILAGVTSITAPACAFLGHVYGPTRDTHTDPTTVVVLAASLFVLAQMTEIALHGRDSAIRSRFGSERRLATVFGAIPEGIVSLSPSGLIEAANPAAAVVLGRSRDDLVGKPAHEVLARLAGVTDGIVAITDATGIRHVEVSTVRSPRTGDEPGAAATPTLVLLRDVSARVAAAERERALSERLHAAQHLETIGQFAGGVAHDINNMIQATYGSLDELEEKLVADDKPAAAAAVRELREIWSRGATLGRELLTFARQRSAGGETVEVVEAFRTLDRLLRRLVPEDITLVLRPPDDRAYLAIDPALFERIVVNLVVNARDAVGSGGQVVVASRRDMTNGEERLLLTVQDDGCGMSEDIRRRMFEPFFTTKEIGRGTGLGMSIVYGAVKQANGEIDVASAPGFGTTFTLSFPLATPPRSAHAGEAPTARRRGGETLLVIDDEVLVRRSTVRMLTGLGYRVLEAGDGLEAVEVARRERIDLVVTDVVMPGLTGPQAAIRIASIRPGTPALFVSGYTGQMVGDRGASDVLIKPFTASELSVRVRRALDHEPAPAAPEPG